MVIIVAVIGAAAPTIAVLATWLLTKSRLAEIHVLVNARLDKVTTELEALKATRDSESEAAKRIVLEAAKERFGEH